MYKSGKYVDREAEEPSPCFKAIAAYFLCFKLFTYILLLIYNILDVYMNFMEGWNGKIHSGKRSGIKSAA